MEPKVVRAVVEVDGPVTLAIEREAVHTEGAISSLLYGALRLAAEHYAKAPVLELRFGVTRIVPDFDAAVARAWVVQDKDGLVYCTGEVRERSSRLVVTYRGVFQVASNFST